MKLITNDYVFLFGTPPADGTLGDHLARLYLKTALVIQSNVITGAWDKMQHFLTFFLQTEWLIFNLYSICFVKI